MKSILSKKAWTNAIKENPITFLLLLTIFIGYGYDYIPIPAGKFQHLNPPLNPHSNWWFGKFVTIYIVGFILQISRLIKNISTLDRDVIKVYFCIDFIGFLSYLYQGWPEPKELFIISFCFGVITVILLSLWRLAKS